LGWTTSRPANERYRALSCLIWCRAGRARQQSSETRTSVSPQILTVFNTEATSSKLRLATMSPSATDGCLFRLFPELLLQPWQGSPLSTFSSVSTHHSRSQGAHHLKLHWDLVHRLLMKLVYMHYASTCTTAQLNFGQHVLAPIQQHQT
jgi:hypothetical protein